MFRYNTLLVELLQSFGEMFDVPLSADSAPDGVIAFDLDESIISIYWLGRHGRVVWLLV